ncbi:aminodeoxychorismate/anthranilate synthase component II [Metallumcola ferriviriculae]|uniref:Aminodeoxychorismate/anthranilate synthase component II n=1 Tax=Metallumcola ferriviriculae TaxID=3039180 RepID=A0AAU0UPV9_9FIRM|nr:aminodeoxychorismate/anthranilate synthase component II [Desulfitibacteraceae bacterium MK1]
MILMIDNYDSFVFNLVQYLGELRQEVKVVRNDRINLSQIEVMAPERIILSPGPCSPDEAGISLELVRYFAGKLPILGVCLGHQAIVQAFGGKVVRADRQMHGKTSEIIHQGHPLLSGLPNPFIAARYHSLIVERCSVPDCLEIIAETERKEIMALAHRDFPVVGVQFHPEAILTQGGHKLLQNFLEMPCGVRGDQVG